MTAMWQRYCELVGGIEYPIVQDGMGPMPCTELAIAVSNGLPLRHQSLVSTARPHR